MPQNPTAQLDDRVTVGPCVISYPNLFVPRAKMTDANTKEYSAEFVVLMETPEQAAQAQQIYQKLMLVANTVAQHKSQRNADAFRNKPIRPLSERKGFENRLGFFFTAKSSAQYRPDVLIGNPPVPVVNPEDVYPGAIVYVNVRAGWYDLSGNQGVKWYLNSVLKVGDGPRLAGDHDPISDFADVLATLPQSALPVAVPPGFAPQAAPPAYPPHGFAPPQAAPPMHPPQGFAPPQAAPPMHPPQGFAPQQPPAGYPTQQAPFPTPQMPGFTG